MMMATVRSFPNAAATHDVLRVAIRERRLVTFKLHGLSRRAEPHDLGIISGETKLFFYQVGGESKSGPPVGWRWATLSEISDLILLDVRFPGPRDLSAGKHVAWDHLIASVSRDVDTEET
jgi:hypothetical protein